MPQAMRIGLYVTAQYYPLPRPGFLVLNRADCGCRVKVCDRDAGRGWGPMSLCNAGVEWGRGAAYLPDGTKRPATPRSTSNFTPGCSCANALAAVLRAAS